MKKLLAIAVAVAFTAPAMADTSVYGSARVLFGDDNGTGEKLSLANNGSRIGLKGSNALDGGLTATHKFELGTNIVDGSGVSMRTSYVGLKGGFGEVRIGSDETPLDDIDGGAGVLTNGGERLKRTDGQKKQSIKYLGKFGPIGVLASYRPKGNNSGITAPPTAASVGGMQSASTKYQVGLSYTAGPIYAAVGSGKEAGLTGTKAPLVVALAYNGANYRVGYVHGKDKGGVKSNSIRGKYSFGKAYVAAEYTKRKATSAAAAALLTGISPVVTSDLGAKQTDLEVGYNLGKGTFVYFQHKNTKKTGVSTTEKSSALGFTHTF